jgi:hypothetical protein
LEEEELGQQLLALFLPLPTYAFVPDQLPLQLVHGTSDP